MQVFIPLGISVGCYLWICISNIRQADYPHALAWFSYALAQTAFIWYEYKKLT
jgi:hypothetical protein